MTGAYIALLVGAMSASLISRDNLRGIIWLSGAQIAFWLSVLYWDLNLPLPMLFAAICDATIVYAIYIYGKEKWEEWIMLIFVLSILTNFTGQALNILDENFNIYIYSWSLYIINWVALLFIGTASGFKEAGYGRDFFPFSDWTTFLGYKRVMARKKKV